MTKSVWQRDLLAEGVEPNPGPAPDGAQADDAAFGTGEEFGTAAEVLVQTPPIDLDTSEAEGEDVSELLARLQAAAAGAAQGAPFKSVKDSPDYDILEFKDPQRPARVRLILVEVTATEVIAVIPPNAWARRLASRAFQGDFAAKRAAMTRLTVRKPDAVGEQLASTAGTPVRIAAMIAKLPVEVLSHVRRAEGESTENLINFVGDGGAPHLPLGPAILAEVARLSAGVWAVQRGRQTAGKAAPPSAEVSQLTSRLAGLEEKIGAIAKALPLPPSRQPSGGSTPRGAVPARAQQALANAAIAPSAPHLPIEGTVGQEAARFGSLDPVVVREARAAGIPMEDIAKMGRLLEAGPSRLRAEPQQASIGTVSNVAKIAAGGLREAADDDEDAGLDLPANDQVAAALTHLTKIVGSLTQRRGSSDPLEKALEGLSGGAVSGESGGAGGSGSRAAHARRLLEAALIDSPEKIYEPIEQLMARACPPAALNRDGSVDPRWYLENRSRMSNFKSNVTYAWTLAGIWRSLQAEPNPSLLVRQARARAALGVVAAEQVSLDNGSWLVAQEVLLEKRPPFGSFDRRSSEPGELPFSELLPDTHRILHLAHLKELDDTVERRRRLMKAPPAPPPPVKGAPDPGRQGGTDASGKGKPPPPKRVGQAKDGKAAEGAQA